MGRGAVNAPGESVLAANRPSRAKLGVCDIEAEQRSRLFDCHARSVAHVAYRMTGASREDIEDLVQEVFEVALRSYARFRGESSERTWILGIASRCCLGHLRRRSRLARAVRRLCGLCPTAPPLGPEAAVQRDETSERVQQALTRLDADLRAVVILHHMEDTPVAELAVALGVPEGTVKSRLHRARERLRIALGPEFAPVTEEAVPHGDD
jgi:RNA polymerase sigma-70 factor (ECF subfamily)